MSHVRRDVWKLPVGDTTLEWYGKAVEALQKRPITDITSWWSFGAMHGIDKGIWKGFGFIAGLTQISAVRRAEEALGSVPAFVVVLSAVAPRLSCCF